MKKGFALPTVLIASVVLLMVLAVSVASTTAARNAIKTQYYAQLAQAAGEAGVAFATSCLQNSGNSPTWTNAKPLKPETDCNGDVQSGLPTTVAENDNIRSKFSVGLPTLDSDGRALTIPQAGFVEIVRQSTGAVWRTYQQPAVQATAVPSLCSGAARSDLGWNNAVVSSSPYVFIDAAAATISVAAGATINPGPIFFRKDVTINEAGDYALRAKGEGVTKVYIDGRLVSESASGADGTGVVSLETGCHSVTVQILHGGVSQSTARLAFSMAKIGASRAIAVSDRSWRTSAGNTVGVSDINYSQSSDWTTVREVAAYNEAPYTAGAANWLTLTNDTNAKWTATTHSYTSTATYPANSYSYYRANTSRWEFSTPTEVQIVTACDDSCSVSIDGQVVQRSSGPTAPAVSKVTLAPGTHQVSVELFNGTAGNSAFLLSAQKTEDGEFIDRSDSNWVASPAWYTSAQSLASYETPFRPSPDIYNCNCVTQGTTNLVIDPSFEDAGMTYNSNFATTARSTSAAFSGATGLRNTVASLGGDALTPFLVPNVDAGQTYTISAHVRSSASARLAYAYVKANGQFVTMSDGSQVQYGTFTSGAAGWRRISMTTKAAPSGAVNMFIGVTIPNSVALGTIYDVDALMVSPGPTLRAYGDAYTPGWRSTGAPDQSPSSGPAL